ncbi:hypothetical protein M7I_3138 [Glarea lozoyensis 74030]|uniref:Uncharacterized protein n=1 Tax=Glarea lozoyensis (strain ATCC 74030 / MF5533) TaxID=1104152 RepID=H0EKQ9_GLAL7|nr:hypothetical protein M7I_3138 [Glarea lozoyensis 74030]
MTGVGGIVALMDDEKTVFSKPMMDLKYCLGSQD